MLAKGSMGGVGCLCAMPTVRFANSPIECTKVIGNVSDRYVWVTRKLRFPLIIMELSLTQCDACLAALEELLGQSEDRVVFYERWVEELVVGLSLSSVTIFHETHRDGSLQQTAGAKSGPEVSAGWTADALRRPLQYFRETNTGPVHLAGGTQWLATGLANTSDSELFVVPIRRDDKLVGLVCATWAGQLDSETRETCQQVLLAAVGIAESLEVVASNRLHVADGQWRMGLDAFLKEALAARGSQQLARIVANTGAHLLHCTRVTVVDVGKFSGRVLATTGVAHVKAASEVARRVAHFAVCVAKYGEPVTEAVNDLPPDLEIALADYVDLVAIRQLAAIPLAVGRETQSGHREWVVILEPIADSDVESFEPHMQQFLRYVRQVVATTCYFESLPLFALSRRLGRISSLLRTPRALRNVVGVGVFVVVALAVACIPVPLAIQARGTIQPVKRQHLFAPADGVITSVAVREGDSVASNSIVVTMRRHEIQQRVGGLVGQLETLEAELQSEKSLQLHRSRSEQDNRPREASLRIRQLETSIDSIQSQLQMARDEADTLAVRAPFTGTILSRSPTSQLLGRPVFQGQLLLSLAALESAWELELDIGEHEVRHVVLAQQQHPVVAKFLCAADLSRRYPATLRVLEKSAVVDEGQEARVRAVLDVTTKPGKVPPGTQVVAHLQCGKRALGFIIFRRLIDAVSYAWVF